MRLIPEELGIEIPVGVGALLVRLVRRDGQVFRFSSYDQPITFENEVYLPEDRFWITQIEQNSGTEASNMQISGYLKSDQVTETDLMGRLYDGAKLTLHQVNPDQERFYGVEPLKSIILDVMSLGEVRMGRMTFQVQAMGLSDRWHQNVGHLYSQTCRVPYLFDPKYCNPPNNDTPTANPENFRFTRTLSSIIDSRTLVFSGDDKPTGYYQAGRIVWESGPLIGQEMEVKDHENLGGPSPQAKILLQLPFPYAPVVGNTAMLEAGCPRTFDICVQRFGNSKNYFGEPDGPGPQATIQILR